MIRYYILPVDLRIINGQEYRGPSYLKWRWNPDGLDVPWSMRDYGGMGATVMLTCVDATVAEHTWLAEQIDVFAFPENIDVNPSPSELSTLEASMDASFIPAQWLSPSETWRVAMRTIIGMFVLMGRFVVKYGSSPLDIPGLTLGTRFDRLDPAVAAAMVEAFESLGFDTSVIKNNWTLRVILKNAADQWGQRPWRFGNLATL